MLLLRKLLMLILAAAPAYCSTITYEGTDPTAWAASTTGTGAITSLNFNNFYIGSTPYTCSGTGDCKTTYDSAGITVGGATFTDTNGNHFLDVEYYSSISAFGLSGSQNNPIKLTPPANTTAVGVNLMTWGGSDSAFIICVSTNGTDCAGQSYSGTISKAPTQTFFGVTSTTPIAWIGFTGANPSYTTGFANFEYVVAGSTQQPSDTPEPLTALLFGSGLMLLLAGRHARKHMWGTAQA